MFIYSVMVGFVFMREYESASSINTFRQCPRKYYYHYILGLPIKNTIYTLRGNIIHLVLQDFFGVELEDITDYEGKFREIVINLFNYHWIDNLQELKDLGLENGEIKDFYNQSLMMLDNFARNFSKKILKELENGLSLKQAFEKIKPQTEMYYISEDYKIQGYIDAIHNISGDIILIDYKTSKKTEITREYELQLALYALMYQEKHGVLPTKVGINFLISGEEYLIDVNNELLLKAKMACEEIHTCTLSYNIKDYSRNITKLCDWGSGKCEFYNRCFNQKVLVNFK